ncbi:MULTISPECIES: protein-glutamate O-methyltransferase CheR [Marinobacter]|jgi:chemotaxis protein methyltransferase CheR|uniref:Chemotaxis protein methyltransferase n=2 Tax=Marinobacter TaxID=2742 RepID=A0ABY1FME6_9GAMM|nr:MULTISPECIES: protein-glutamate O-methyltransferase CheR [Marinobacter]KXJ45038.1 MAG: chemotaxis protein [Marinobacter sp. Hex_13]MBS8231320.1 protein-glutamate O-methyltransferase CheR [Marinobacter salarius]WOI18140.1 protein-glutamate O-methyltransferase CheR [Marinobacter salarius]SFL63230.1 chemotaxis protein methyltransferase CheR [Marinobacter salarius]|tara:strand:+ start:1388 stop:2215 length:828 start_codon:yes stop_codon:yes gene_type:complete
MKAEITPQEYEAFKTFLQDACGILLGDNKQYLVKSRLRRIMEENKLSTLGDLLDRVKRTGRSSLKEVVIDAMTTNETLWFRDNHPFRILQEKLLPEFGDRKSAQSLRIWSAACSTGQEPYSVAMIIEEFRRQRPGRLRDVKITATDISKSVLEVARRGEYEMIAIGRGLSPERQKQFFTPAMNGSWQIRPQIKSMVEFRELNLLERYMLGKFDIVMCRNVLIYFSAELKKDILTRIHATLNPGGYLILGASESLNGLPHLYEMVQCHPGIIYRKK